MTLFDPQWTCREMHQVREFWIYSLTEINDSENHRLGRVWQAAFAGKKCQHVHSIIERVVKYSVSNFRGV